MLFLLCAAYAISTVYAQSTHSDAEYLPPPDPGYGLYFHGDDGALEKPQRWGYHDGWLQGRRDRSEGRQQDPRKEEAYTKGLHHGAFGDLPEEQYLRVYRSAYLRGYEHGYRI